ncbi:hypothetical protein NEDG_01318 [Nematocida displodere]|uniref:Uncharacterized protein n=1 Tax=Nematocida displodere TaxID=1805483 RepID=A0A177EBD1_9MICR|nr:hypothetical protein NEDG_01318 [Nematocida displodere]
MEEIDTQCIDSPHTLYTLAFFKGLGCDLRTSTVMEQAYIVKNQWHDINIHLSKCTFEQTPKHLVRGMVFRHLTLSLPRCNQHQLELLNKKVVERVLRALGVIYAKTLVIEGVSENATDMLIQSSGGVAEPSNALAASTDTEHKESAPRLTRVETNCLELNNMTDALVSWFFGYLDVSDREFSLVLHNAHGITNLQVLDCFDPKGLTSLHCWGMDALTSIDCALLREQKVWGNFKLQGTKRLVGASMETLQGITAMNWNFLRVPADLWRAIATKAPRGFVVGELGLTVDFTQEFDPFWDVWYRERTSLKTLKLNLVNRYNKPKSKSTFTKILQWIDSTFRDVVQATIFKLNIQSPLLFPSYRFICIEPYLPTLRSLYCRFAIRHTLHLYSAKSTLWIAPDAYHIWQSGSLNEEMKEVCRQIVLSIDAPTPTPFLPPQSPEPNPVCFVCCISLSMINQLDPHKRPIYIGIVCKKGAMACQPCLNNLAATKQATNEALHCPCCNSEIVDTRANGIIFLAAPYTPRFIISHLDPNTN